MVAEHLVQADRFYMHDGELLLPYLYCDVPTVISLRDSVYPETIIDGGASPSLFQHPRSLPAHGMH